MSLSKKIDQLSSEIEQFTSNSNINFDIEINNENSYNQFYKTLSEFGVDNNSQIFKKNCHFCNHPERTNAERIYDERNSFAPVVRFFAEYHQSNPNTILISRHSCMNHLTNHFAKLSSKLFVQEYSEKLNNFLNIGITSEQRLNNLIVQLEIKLNELAADPTIDEIRQAEIMIKLSDSICKLVESKTKMRDDLDATIVLTQKLSEVWLKLIEKEGDPRVKQRFIEALDSFRSIDGMKIVENKKVKSMLTM